MPEIAEVETVRRTLKKMIAGKTIKKVDIYYAPIIQNESEEFKKILEGQTFTGFNRVGKWLIFELGNYCLLSHLRMEGKYFLKPVSDPIEKHEHVVFIFEDNTTMRYHDTRKFGRMILVPKEKVWEVESIQKQGKEPNSKELTKEYLYEKIKKKNLPMKTIFLDQTIISGLGNIYANEVLFAAKINPLTKGKDITLEECQNIIIATNEIIKKAMEAGGTTIRSYTSSLGVTGRFQTNLMVHQREQEPCKICKTPIENIKIGGRSTYYCTKCQNSKEKK